MFIRYVFLYSTDVIPLPRVDDLLDQLGEAKVFSCLDEASGYWQIPVREDAIPKTAFATHHGLFEFVVMPFGLCNGPATFQRVMQIVLSGLEHFCSVYIDDTIVFSPSVEEHLHHLEQIFDRLRRAGLKLKPQKCQFLRKEVPYLGYVVSAEGLATDPQKTEAIRKFPTPKNVTELRSFLGLSSYYRRFISGFSKLAHPLYDLLKKDIPFEWNASCQAAFNQLRERLSSTPVLAHPDFSKAFYVETDASQLGLGAVLEQEQSDGKLHPVAYASRTLQPSEKRYGITELEALGWSGR